MTNLLGSDFNEGHCSYTYKPSFRVFGTVNKHKALLNTDSWLTMATLSVTTKKFKIQGVSNDLQIYKR